MPDIEKLHLEDAFEDGPQTRSLLRLFETDALKLRSYVVSLHRCFSRIICAQKELCAATQCLSTHLKDYDQQRFPLENDESILSSTLGQFAVFLDELSSVQQVLFTQLGDSTMFPINKFLQADLDEILTLKEVFQSATDEHERTLATYMRFPKKKEQDKVRQEVVDDLYVARKKFHQTALHYYTSLNLLQYKRKASLLEPLIGLMNAQKTFFEIGREAIVRKDIDEFVGNISASVQGVQTELKEASQKMAQQIETIEEASIHRYYAEPLPDMPRVSPNCTLAQKAGYLFIRTKPTLLSTRWDRSYFFIQGGNLMCQAKDEVAGSPILDLNEQIKMEAIDIEDRRFVFQVTQLSSKKTVILQAENAFERNEWMATIGNASNDGLASASSSSTVRRKESGGESVTPDAASSSSSISGVLSSVPVVMPKTTDKFRDSKSFVRSSSHPATPPSTPVEGTFFPDAPIQFDIITPSLHGSDSQPRRMNPFNSADGSGQTQYPVRFLGSQQVTADRGEPVVLETVRQIMTARAIYNIFKMTEFHLAIDSGAVRLLDPANGNITAEFSLRDVSYWAVHNENQRLFGFITRMRDTTTSDKSTFTCYIFECNSSGEEICQAMATATQTAFQMFMQHEAEKMKAMETELLMDNIKQLEDQPHQLTASADGQIVDPAADGGKAAAAAEESPSTEEQKSQPTDQEQNNQPPTEKPSNSEAKP